MADSVATVPNILSRAHENDYGQLEYKYKLTNLTPEQKDRLTSQLKYRVNTDDHRGQAMYNLGLTDDGFALGLTRDQLDESLKNLADITQNAGMKICNTNIHEVVHYAESKDDLMRCATEKRFIGPGQKVDPDSAETKRAETSKQTETSVRFVRFVAEVIIRDIIKQKYVDLRMGVAGNVDSGKSTLTGVLTKGILDNGRGSARLKVFNFKHEITSGRTSSIGQQIMGFDDKGNSVADVITIKNPEWEDIVKSSTKIITFFDLAGHESYLKTTIHGIASNRPDYCLIMVGANIGSNKGAKMDMTIEHVKLCLHMKIPFIIVMTKIDLAPPNVMKETLNYIKSIIKKKVRKVPLLVKSEEDLAVCVDQVASGTLVPIFKISNVKGTGLEMFKHFLNRVPVRKTFRKASKRSVRMQIQDIYTVEGVGTVVGGMIVSGKIAVGDTLKIGPNSLGEFQDAYVRSIQCKTVDVQEAVAATWITVNIPRVKRDKIRKGMYLLSDAEALTHWEFKAKIYLDSQNSINLKVGYQPHCHIGHITQTCKITDIISIDHSKESIKNLAQSGKIIVTQDTQNNLTSLLKLYRKNKELLTGSEADVVAGAGANKKQKKKRKDPSEERNRIISLILDSNMLDTQVRKILQGEITQTELDTLSSMLSKAVLPNLGPGDSAELKIRFCFRPEVIFEDEKKRFIFREGVTRGIGRITGVTDAKYEALSNKKVTKGNKKRSVRKRRSRKK